MVQLNFNCGQSRVFQSQLQQNAITARIKRISIYSISKQKLAQVWIWLVAHDVGQSFIKLRRMLVGISDDLVENFHFLVPHLFFSL